MAAKHLNQIPLSIGWRWKVCRSAEKEHEENPSQQQATTHRVKDDMKSGVDEGRPPNIDLNDVDLHFVTSPHGHGHYIAKRFHYTNAHPDFGLGDATPFDWSEVPNTLGLTMEIFRQICSSLHFYSTNSDDFHIQCDGAQFFWHQTEKPQPIFITTSVSIIKHKITISNRHPGFQQHITITIIRNAFRIPPAFSFWLLDAFLDTPAFP